MTILRSTIVTCVLILAAGCTAGPSDESGNPASPASSLTARIRDSIITQTETQTATQTSTGTETATYTQTATSTTTQTATGSTATETATANNLAVTGTGVGTVTLRNDYVPAKTAVWTATLTRADTAGTTFIGSGTGTGTYAAAGVTYTGSGTTTLTMQLSSIATGTATRTVAAYYTGALSKTVLGTGTGIGWSGRITWTYTKTGTGTNSGTVTQTETQTLTETLTTTTTETVTITTTGTTTSTSIDAGTSVDGAGSCLQSWRGTTCGQWCTRETQADRRQCLAFLDCYLEHGVAPSNDPDSICGVNRFTYGMVPKTIADQVYQCLACPGSAPVVSCAGLPDTTPCTDGNACTLDDRCQGGACIPGAPRPCTSSDACHESGTCDPGTGQCSNPAKPAGTLCRPAVGLCDVAELCDGTDAGCPADGFATAGTVCRASAVTCDPAETCDGSSTTCPPDATTGEPAVPSGLSALPGDGTIRLAWTASPGASGYNIKRGAASGGPYSTLFTSTIPSFVDMGLTNQTAYYYVVSAVNGCGESADSAVIPAVPSTAIPPRRLPKAPAEVGCYWYTLNGWESIPCTPASEVIAKVGKPVIPPSLSSPYVEATPNPSTSPNPVLVPPTGSTPLPFVFAQAEILFPAIGGLQDVVPTPAPTFPGCLTSAAPKPNALSVQLNTNKFMMANGDNGAVQFAIQSAGLNDPEIHMCAWQVDVTTQDYDASSLCVTAPPPTRDTPLGPFDFVNIAGAVNPGAGTMSIVVELSWVEPGWPNIYAQTGADKYGLGNHWLQFDAAVLGLGGCTEAQFTDASVVTRMMGSTCPGVTSPTSSTSGCPADTLEPHASFENRTATAETNNLIQLGAPAVSYPNPYLAVTNTTSTTSGACIDPRHVYVRDYERDNGAVPSNAAGQAFWESPDIFLVPKDSPVSPYSTPAQSIITPDTDFDVYVRVHNDLGCAPVTGAKALVYIADPSGLSTAWNPLTDNQYKAATAAGNTVAAGDRSLIGPFRYHAPATGYGDGHKCLIAAIMADGEDAVSNYSDAPNSNQVAQRNVQLEDCAYPLTNATGTDGEVTIALNVVPTSPAPSLSGLDISVTFDDADSAWYDVWVAQSGNGSDYSVSKSGGKTKVRLGKASITLHAVPIGDGESRAAKGTLDLPIGAPQTTLNIQATLRNPSSGTLLAPTNGGACKATGPTGPL